MESSRAKIVGPAIAAGAVSLGLILIGSCGVGKQDTYIAPPPIRSAVDAAPVVVRDGTTATAPKVIIPPSPTWRIAPIAPPPRTITYDPSASIEPTEPGESTTRPPRTTTLRTTTPPPPAPAVTTEPQPATTRPDPTTVEPTTTADEPTITTRRSVTSPPAGQSEEVDE